MAQENFQSDSDSRSPVSCGCWVIALIFVVMTIPVLFEGSRVHPNSLKTDARNSCLAVANAIEQFLDEYGRLPLSPGAAGPGDVEVEMGASNALTGILKGTRSQENPKGLDFLGDIKMAEAKDGIMCRGLLKGEGGHWALLDSWGQPYRVRLDMDGDGSVENPVQPGPPRLEVREVVWSCGKDGSDASREDNISSHMR